MNQIEQIPDFTSYGYQIIKKLRQNQDSSLITWQAKSLENNIIVVIKQFRFATKDSSWVDYQACQQEMELLKNLNYPGIPKYISNFETDNSFCFVREYIKAKSLGEINYLTESELKKITVKILNILIYLQQQQPAVSHLNITPQNILIDGKQNVYLINFGVNQNSNSIKLSNAEFIAPEQFNSPCAASDLYSLGNSLINFIHRQETYSLQDSNNLNQVLESNLLDSGFQDWLNTITEIEPNQRYPDAETALNALQINSWDELDSIPNSTENMTLSQRAFTVGIATMGILGTAIAVNWKITEQVTEKSLINITIALMGIVIIYLAQSAATTIITNDQNEKKQAISLAISVPLILTIVTGFIFGKGEAIAMGLATIIAQTATLAYVLQQKLPLDKKENIFKIMGLVIAIAFGLWWGTIIKLN